MEKVCFKCKAAKPLSDFYRHKKMADGHLNKCKECTKLDVRRNRQESENAREYDKRRYRDNPKRRASILERAAQRYADNPEQKRAHTAVSNAVRDGRLEKPHRCSRCRDNSRRIEAHHHEGYDHPLEVTWVCPPCHRILDGVTKIS